MEDVRKLVSEIKTVSSKIIRRAIPMMEDIEDDDGEYVQMFMDEYPDLKHEKIKNVLQDITTAWVADAEKTRLEIDTFIIFDGDQIKTNEGCSDFFAQIWAGDVYDKEGTEALQSLLEDLQTQLSLVTEQYLLDEAERLLGKK